MLFNTSLSELDDFLWLSCSCIDGPKEFSSNGGRSIAYEHTVNNQKDWGVLKGKRARERGERRKPPTDNTNQLSERRKSTVLWSICHQKSQKRDNRREESAAKNYICIEEERIIPKRTRWKKQLYRAHVTTIESSHLKRILRYYWWGFIN